MIRVALFLLSTLISGSGGGISTTIFLFLGLLLFNGGSFSRLEDIGQTTFTTVTAIKVVGHEDTSTTDLIGAFTPQTGDLSVLINLVVFKNSELDLLTLMLDLLGGGVSLLLLLLGTTTQTEDQV